MLGLNQLILLAMVLTLLENSTVVVIAVLIYLRQRKANAEMEQEIKKAIAEVKEYMKSPDILGMLVSGVKKQLNSWARGKQGAASRQVNSVGKFIGGINTLRMLQNAKGMDEKALILAEYGMGKYQEHQAQKAAEEGPPMLTPEEYKSIKESEMSPEEYAKRFAEAVNAQGIE